MPEIPHDPLAPNETGPVEIARAETERGELVLKQRRTEAGPTSLELRANGVFVMDTVEVSTEQALAHGALAVLDDPESVLVGGLGLGFTMHEVLADTRVQRCVVVEIEQTLVDWMRDGTIAHGPGMLADERVEVVVADLAVAVAEAAPQSFDLVLMDVDNGPGYLVHDTNAALYHRPFLHVVKQRLRPGGVLAVWSAADSPELAENMAAVFAHARTEEHPVQRGNHADHYLLYLGTDRPQKD